MYKPSSNSIIERYHLTTKAMTEGTSHQLPRSGQTEDSVSPEAT